MKSNTALALATQAQSTWTIAVLAALAQETRLAIFRLLVEHAVEGLTPGAIALKLKIPPATLSFHLKELSHAGLLLDRKEGRFIWYRPDMTAMTGLIDYLTENCCRASGATCGAACAPAACPPATRRARSKS
jgi:DNA-binding transcriptional ArsR family regulator